LTLFDSFNIAELSDANLKLVDRFKKLQQMVKKTVSTFEEQQTKKQNNIQKRQMEEQRMLDGKTQAIYLSDRN